ncbi:delta-1-pyrroline-5-carboxylate dehydrogenase [Capsaspora owczarzaki ATCC 30864]|uniref:Multifunctional fusion protein n=1 Tax=Capsaspora owczarzaki (strain ATCC 30864) TaxID=595528 RepID=A0A0D2WX04_CAPO3|nr:delta-1-pyrroline-5-carboxylate dehydrogenase [Capsaspora owczarzaki ATCC 30864]KJE97595.1 delta-1-pyrroline-5-carboxylate dehydrogenase [Capsaspora owczarzaki ATCC 30864]|eukprot:XP_004343284.1 delta-1-pyrroline-5-carboxylate dehydrogenase [Capsaspora owczarzaki ATCC 30864]
MLSSALLRVTPGAASTTSRRFLSNAVFSLPPIANEPNYGFMPGSAEREAVVAACRRVRSEVVEIPCVVGGERITTSTTVKQVIPSQHKQAIATIHHADKSVLEKAAQNALITRESWSKVPFEHRAAVFLRAADLLSTTYRARALATTMIGQSKTVQQAEIDAAAELADFWRFNVKYMREMYAQQPEHHSSRVWNRVDYRPLEGFVAGISPFNFTAIGGNLGSSAAIAGNVVLWKPSDTSMLSNWVVYEILREAGLPDGVVNFVPADGPTFGKFVTKHPDLAAIAFTGSTPTFQWIWKEVGNHLAHYKSYPRLIGETGGKNFHLVHPTADVETVVNGTIRSAFEYQGQKCSACSRIYLPRSLAPTILARLVEETGKITMGQPDDFKSFMSAVIDDKSAGRISGYIDRAKTASAVQVLAGGKYDFSEGYFVQPTILLTTDPKYETMRQEIFGPVLTAYIYEDNQFEHVLKLVNESTAFSLTGSIFARDRNAIVLADSELANAAGNFYINDRCTGSVVGQQPFGGSRMSGTNDKAGFGQFMQRLVSTRAVKEQLVPLTEWKYNHMV